MNSMKSIGLLLFFLYLPVFLFAHSADNQEAVMLDEALKKRWVSMVKVSREKSNALSIVVKNKRKQQGWKLCIPHGSRFASDDTLEQDQIIVKDIILVFGNNPIERASISSFCTQASNSSPRIGSTFAYRHRAEGNLLKLTDFFASKGDVPGITQQAVWVLTDNRSLDGLYHQNPMIQKKTQELVSKLSRKPMPRYVKEYSRLQPGQRASDLVIRSLRGAHQLKAPRAGEYACIIYGPDGEVVKSVFKPRFLNDGTDITIRFKLKNSELKEGFYRSKVTVDGELVEEIIIRC